MNKVTILIVSLVFGVLDVLWVRSLNTELVNQTFGVAALGPIFVGVILVPIILFVYGFFSTKEGKNRVKNGLTWLSISFVVILAINLLVGVR